MLNFNYNGGIYHISSSNRLVNYIENRTKTKYFCGAALVLLSVFKIFVKKKLFFARSPISGTSDKKNSVYYKID